MEITSYTVTGYLTGATLTAIRLGWYIAKQLDKFDWHCSKSHIWTVFVLSVLFWPIMFLKPANFVNPREIFSDKFDFMEHSFAENMREESRLWNNPPPCGSLICYQPNFGGYQETFGKFIFHSDDVEKILENRLRNNPHLVNGHEGAVLNWLKHRDESLIEPTFVPDAWYQFDFVADDMLRNGLGEIYCLKCNKPIVNNQMLQKDDHGKPGWNFHRLICPNEHPLLVVEWVHLHMTK